MGLCQWGAREMVAQGFDYKNYFFYYPYHVDEVRIKKKNKKYARV